MSLTRTADAAVELVAIVLVVTAVAAGAIVLAALIGAGSGIGPTGVRPGDAPSVVVVVGGTVHGHGHGHPR